MASQRKKKQSQEESGVEKCEVMGMPDKGAHSSHGSLIAGMSPATKLTQLSHSSHGSLTASMSPATRLTQLSNKELLDKLSESDWDMEYDDAFRQLTKVDEGEKEDQGSITDQGGEGSTTDSEGEGCTIDKMKDGSRSGDRGGDAFVEECRESSPRSTVRAKTITHRIEFQKTICGQSDDDGTHSLSSNEDEMDSAFVEDMAPISDESDRNEPEVTNESTKETKTVIYIEHEECGEPDQKEKGDDSLASGDGEQDQEKGAESLASCDGELDQEKGDESLASCDGVLDQEKGDESLASCDGEQDQEKGDESLASCDGEQDQEKGAKSLTSCDRLSPSHIRSTMSLQRSCVKKAVKVSLTYGCSSSRTLSDSVYYTPQSKVGSYRNDTGITPDLFESELVTSDKEELDLNLSVFRSPLEHDGCTLVEETPFVKYSKSAAMCVEDEENNDKYDADNASQSSSTKLFESSSEDEADQQTGRIKDGDSDVQRVISLENDNEMQIGTNSEDDKDKSNNDKRLNCDVEIVDVPTSSDSSRSPVFMSQRHGCSMRRVSTELGDAEVGLVDCQPGSSVDLSLQVEESVQSDEIEEDRGKQDDERNGEDSLADSPVTVDTDVETPYHEKTLSQHRKKRHVESDIRECTGESSQKKKRKVEADLCSSPVFSSTTKSDCHPAMSPVFSSKSTRSCEEPKREADVSADAIDLTQDDPEEQDQVDVRSLRGQEEDTFDRLQDNNGKMQSYSIGLHVFILD